MPNDTKNGRGRRPDPTRAMMRQMFSEWSDRTFARWWKCFQRLMALKAVGAIDDDGYKAAITAATRPNGSLNISKLEQVTEDMAAIWLVKNGLLES